MKRQTPLPFMNQSVFGSMSAGRVINNVRTENQTKTDISNLTVNSQASNPVEIAGDIMDAIKKASPSEQVFP